MQGNGQYGWGYTHDHHADKYPYLHDRRADKYPYLHDRRADKGVYVFCPRVFSPIAYNWIQITFYLKACFAHALCASGERGGSVVECRTPEREVGGSKPTAAVLCPWARHFTPRKYWLITQEAVAPSRYDWKIVDWDVKPQHKPNLCASHVWNRLCLVGCKLNYERTTQ